MRRNMASIAILCLLLMERFLFSDMDSFTEPVLNGLRTLENTAMKYARKLLPEDILKARRKLTRFYLYTPQFRSEGQRLNLRGDNRGFLFFNPRLETKVIIHGFLDSLVLADWMRHMKDEFLMLDNFNVIIVDWSFGNSIPYTVAAANTEKTGKEISELIIKLRDEYDALPEKFHLIGHSLGSHVAGYVGETVKGLKRITALDPATYLFTDASPRAKLDRSDADFVDVIHTDGGGIGMMEAVGHVDFYPNGGQIQPGCTASNSLRALLEKGVVEGARSVICSHMRAPLLFTDSINVRQCQKIAHKCSSWEAFSRGECDTCGESGKDCAVMSYHMDIHREYGNFSKYYLLTSASPSFCGYEYKLTLKRDANENTSTNWPMSSILQISVYGSNGNADFQIEKKKNKDWQESHVVFSPSYLGDVLGAIVRWNKKPVSRSRGVMELVSSISPFDDGQRPIILRIHFSSLKTYTQWRIAPIIFELCVHPMFRNRSQHEASFRSEYC